MKAGIIGLGARSTAYLPVIKALADGQVTALCDVDEVRITRYIHTFLGGVKPFLTTTDPLMLMRSDEVDTILICTPDTTHPVLLRDAVATGKSILLEKPVATTIAGAREVYRLGDGYSNSLAIGFVLRYTQLYSKVHELVEQGELGQIISMTAREMLDPRHAGSFYRRWNRFSSMTGGLMNTKCCHDLDILNWIAGSVPLAVTAFGGRRFFVPDKDASERCSHCLKYEGCTYAFDYGYYEEMYKGFVSVSDICVFNSDKDIVDHEILNIRYENGVVAQFELNMFAPEENRQMTIFGTKAMLQADFARSTIVVKSLKGQEKNWSFQGADIGHGGGDKSIITELDRAAIFGTVLNHARAGFLSTAIALAGEESMANGGIPIWIRE